MSDLVTLQEVKEHLRIATSDEDGDLAFKLQAAQAIVLSHMTQRDDGEWDVAKAAWTQTTVPLTVKQAILMQLTELYEVRGDDPRIERPMRGGLSPVIDSLINPHKDPGIA